MIEAAPFNGFSISILDNGYSVLITILSQINDNKNVTAIKRKVFCFSIRFIWFQSAFLNQNEEKCYKIVRLL